MAQQGKKPRKKKPLWVQVRNTLRTRLLSGLLVVVPLGITAFVLNFLYDFTAGRLSPLIEPSFGEFPEYVVPALSLAVLLLLLYVVGLAASVMVGRRLIALMEAILRRIPIVKGVYGASKQVVDAFSFKNGNTRMKSAVFIDFPHPGMKAIAFVTGTLDIEGLPPHYRIFIPTTPNPSSGYLEMIPQDQVAETSLSVEEAVKFVISGGLLGPETFETLARGRGVNAETPRSTSGETPGC